MVSSPTQRIGGVSLSSPSLPAISEDELFDPQYKRPSGYETVSTVPLNRIPDSPEQDTLASLPFVPNGQQTQRGKFDSQSQYANTSSGRHITQPTQLLDHPPSEISSPPSRTMVQVAASSPIATPISNPRKPSGILASAMAPAGTAFRRPFVPPAIASRKPISINSDDEGSSSDESDRAERERSNIKTSTFVRKSAAEKVPESPQNESGLSKFKNIAQGYGYRPTDYNNSLKRSSDTMANAYGNVSKRPRQLGPSRAQPVTSHNQDSGPEPDMTVDDIGDASMRAKVKRLRSVLFPNLPIRLLHEALLKKRGNFDDAAEYIAAMSEATNNQSGAAIDLTGASEDELLKTPAAVSKKQLVTRAPVIPLAKQQAKRPTQSIQEKWSNTQSAVRKPSVQNKKLDIFDDPGPSQPKARKLMRGRKDRDSPSAKEPQGKTSDEQKKPAIVIDDDSDAGGDSGVHSDGDDGTFDDRLLKFFNKCTAMDLADTANITREIAEHFVSKQPFRSLEAVGKVENPKLKPTKTKRKTPPMGEKIVDKVDEMLRSYEAVDYLVKKCEAIAKPLTAEMKNWGVDIFGKAGSGELEITNLTSEPQRSGSSHDSGIGTPISDDDHDAIRGYGSRKVFGQPVSMAEDIVMKDYQIVGVNWLSLLFRNNYSCILADDMGLGKTLQTIAFIAHLAETGVKGPHLIVVPAATLENWLKEFHRFCPGLVVEPYYATNPTERFDLREQFDDMKEEINVIVTTYTIAKAKDDFPWLRSFGFCCTIFDEGHALKNADSKVTKNLMRIDAKWRLLLTGTPLQNNLKELMSLLFFLMPKIFKQKQEELEVIFKQDIKTINDDAESREMLLSKKRIERARSMLTPFILRRKKWQVLKDLPKKERKVEYCELNAEQANIYNGWLAKAFDVRERRARGERIPIDESANILMKLRQAAIHPLLFRQNYQDIELRKIAKACLKDPMWAESNPDLILQELNAYSDFEVHQLCARSKPLQKFMLAEEVLDRSGKVQTLIRLLKQFISEGHRVLVFSQFVMVLDVLELVLSHHDIKFFRLDGNTKVSERQDLIDEFNGEIDETAPDAAKKKADQVPVFMLSTKAGGAGINLASASRVIIFDSGFNPQDDVQAENRAHRIGQKKEVEVWRLVTKGSVEEQIHGMGMIKLRLDREVAGEGAEDGEETSGQAADKKGEEKEMQGLKLVEEMLFKKFDDGDDAPDTTKADVEKANESASAIIHDIDDIAEDDAKPLVNKEEVTTVSTNNSDLRDDFKTTKIEQSDREETKPSSQRSTSSRRKDSIEMTSRPRVSRPKAGSRKNSSRSTSQKSRA